MKLKNKTLLNSQNTDVYQDLINNFSEIAGIPSDTFFELQERIDLWFEIIGKLESYSLQLTGFEFVEKEKLTDTEQTFLKTARKEILCFLQFQVLMKNKQLETLEQIEAFNKMFDRKHSAILNTSGDSFFEKTTNPDDALILYRIKAFQNTTREFFKKWLDED